MSAFRFDRPDLRIQIPLDCSETVRFAADQLAYYLALITGRSLQVTCEPGALCIGLDAVLPPGGYRWEVCAESVRIAGANGLACLHGVYHFLEVHGGCRWLSPWEGGEIVPRTESLTVPAGEWQHQPAFGTRAFTNYPDIDERTVQMVDWMAKNRFSRFVVFANVEGAWDRYREVLAPHTALRGIGIELGHHSFRFWLPPAEHFADHPEWYAVLGGERSAAGQLCVTNPEVSGAIAERIAAFHERNPEVVRVALWPNDGYGWCECESCSAADEERPSLLYPQHPVRTDAYVGLVNRVARELARSCPGLRLSALAYVNYVEPPSLMLEPNVDLCFAPFQHCFRHSLGEEACERPNAAYARLLHGWRQKVQGELYLFAYWMLIDMFSLPVRPMPALATDLKWLVGEGCGGFMMEFRPQEWGVYGWIAHLIGRLSWEPEMDVGEWLRGHLEALFGPAAPEMATCLAALERDFLQPGGCISHYGLQYTRRATPELLRPAMEHLGRAVAAACRGERSHRENTQRARIGFELLLRTGAWQRALADALGASGPRRTVLRDRALQYGEELARWAQAHAESGALYAPDILRRVEAASKTVGN
jgi:hypothetical protein